MNKYGARKVQLELLEYLKGYSGEWVTRQKIAQDQDLWG